MFRIVAILIACFALSCGKKSERPDEVVDVAPTPAPPELGESKCDGNRVPPTQYLQETAFVPNGPNARQEASVAAVAQLRDRICQGYRCGELDQYITIWNTEQDSLSVCAMAVIKGTDVETFKDGPRRAFDADLKARAQEIVTQVNARREPRIAFDNITDFGVDGGPRAKWLADRMTTALSQSGALISTIPPDWSGLGLPSGTDAVLRANITPVYGRESMLEVTWKVQLAAGMKAVDVITFPELIGPAVNPLTYLTELAGINPNIAIRLTGEQDGGGLCSGQETQMILETSRDLYVRVINLFGDGSRGIVIFDQKTPVKANTTHPIGGSFKASAYGGIPAERFLVFGSETLDGLGPLAEVSGLNCRLPEALATQYSSNRGFPPGAGRFTTSRSYRILTGPECSDHTPDTLPAGWFDTLPDCFQP